MDDRVVEFMSTPEIPVRVAFDNKPVSLEAMVALAATMKPKPIEALSFDNADLTDIEVKVLSDALVDNVSMVQLSLCGNAITPTGAADLANAIADKPALERLMLDKNKELGLEGLSVLLPVHSPLWQHLDCT